MQQYYRVHCSYWSFSFSDISVWITFQFWWHFILGEIKFLVTFPFCWIENIWPTSSSCGGLRPLAQTFMAVGQKTEFIMLFWPILGYFWCSVVPLVTFSSNFSNFKKNNKSKKFYFYFFYIYFLYQNLKKSKKKWFFFWKIHKHS